MSNYNQQHAADFAEWRIRHPHEVVDTPEEAGITSTLKVGDKVTFTNKYGVKFPGHRVIGFGKPTLGNRCVYLDIDCYWFPVMVAQWAECEIYVGPESSAEGITNLLKKGRFIYVEAYDKVEAWIDKDSKPRARMTSFQV